MITGLFVGVTAVALLAASAWKDRTRNTASREPK